MQEGSFTPERENGPFRKPSSSSKSKKLLAASLLAGGIALGAAQDIEANMPKGTAQTEQGAKTKEEKTAKETNLPEALQRALKKDDFTFILNKIYEYREYPQAAEIMTDITKRHLRVVVERLSFALDYRNFRDPDIVRKRRFDEYSDFQKGLVYQRETIISLLQESKDPLAKPLLDFVLKTAKEPNRTIRNRLIALSHEIVINGMPFWKAKDITLHRQELKKTLTAINQIPDHLAPDEVRATLEELENSEE